MKLTRAVPVCLHYIESAFSLAESWTITVVRNNLRVFKINLSINGWVGGHGLTLKLISAQQNYAAGGLALSLAKYNQSMWKIVVNKLGLS